MASLVSALKGDCAAAASGTVEFYSMGTSTLSSLVYSDANGVTRETTHQLDAYGRITRYVGEPVDVVVKNASGATVDTFTHIDDARCVRLESSAFTGPNTNGNGQIVAGGRTTEAAAWALMRASLGTTDGEVLVGGAAVALSAAVSGFFINVADYGTDPTGNSDSTTALTNAFNAANIATGAYVYFPPGTYKITEELTVPANCYVFGAPGGPGTSGGVTIKQYTDAILGWFTVASTADVVIEGIDFQSNSAAFTGRMIYAGGISGGRVILRNCSFGAFAGDNLVTASTTAYLIAEDCLFASAGETQDFIDLTTQSVATLSNCRFIGTGGLANFEAAASCRVYLSDCDIYSDTGLTLDELFDGTGTYSITGGKIEIDNAGTMTICGNGTVSLVGVRIMEGTGAGTIALTAGAATMYEAGCQTNGTVVVCAAAASAWFGHSQIRDHAETSSSATSVSLAPDAANYAVVKYTQTSGAAFAWSNPTIDAPVGSLLTLIYYNTTGGNITTTFGNAYGANAVTITNNNNASAWSFRREAVGSNVKWVALGGQVTWTP